MATEEERRSQWDRHAYKSLNSLQSNAPDSMMWKIKFERYLNHTLEIEFNWINTRDTLELRHTTHTLAFTFTAQQKNEKKSHRNGIFYCAADAEISSAFSFDWTIEQHTNQIKNNAVIKQNKTTPYILSHSASHLIAFEMANSTDWPETTFRRKCHTLELVVVLLVPRIATKWKFKCIMRIEKMRTIESLPFDMFDALNSFRSFSGYFHALTRKKENSNDTSSLSITFKMSNSKQLWPIVVCDRITKLYVHTQCAKNRQISLLLRSIHPICIQQTRENIHEFYELSLRKLRKSQICIYFSRLPAYMHEGDTRAPSHDHDYAVFILVSILSLCFYRVGSMRIDLVSISFSILLFVSLWGLCTTLLGATRNRYIEKKKLLRLSRWEEETDLLLVCVSVCEYFLLIFRECNRLNSTIHEVSPDIAREARVYVKRESTFSSLNTTSKYNKRWLKRFPGNFQIYLDFQVLLEFYTILECTEVSTSFSFSGGHTLDTRFSFFNSANARHTD